jgi:hypothetical protein
MGVALRHQRESPLVSGSRAEAPAWRIRRGMETARQRMVSSLAADTAESFGSQAGLRLGMARQEYFAEEWSARRRPQRGGKPVALLVF